MKIVELFSGYGTASHAGKQLGLDFEIVGYSDIDKYANQCFSQNHGGKELGDVTKIDPNDLEDFDLLTGGFPCQSFSVAGKMLGELDTRGTLFNEIIRIAEVKQPRYMLLENVKGLLSKRHRATLIKITNELHRIGYYVKIRVLNTKDYGIPQNRERVWFACFREKEDWDKFKFPEKEELKIFLKDILEEDVDEKYYLSKTHINRLLTSTDLEKSFSKINPEIAGCMTARQYANWKGNFIVGNVNPSGKGMNGNVYGGDISPTITTNKGEGPKIIKIGNLSGGPWTKRHESSTRVYSVDGVCPTIPTADGGGITPKILSGFRIRKLTPKECFRLQGFLNDEINLEGLSNTQQYKLAGNGQSVNVVKKIFQEMFK